MLYSRKLYSFLSNMNKNNNEVLNGHNKDIIKNISPIVCSVSVTYIFCIQNFGM